MLARNTQIWSFLLLLLLLALAAKAQRQLSGGESNRNARSPPPLQLVHLPEELVTKHGAYCLDGSPYKYYLRKLALSSPGDFVLYFQGGGWCSTLDECRKRWLTNLGSSRNFSEMIAAPHGPALLQASEQVNPLFAAYNHVYLPYCDGASFTGSRREPVSDLWFRGQHNLEAALDHLGLLLVGKDDDQDNDENQDDVPSSSREGVSIDNLLITGCSAGGLATYLHADWIRHKLFLATRTHDMTRPLPRVKALPESGIFLFHDNVLGQPLYEQFMKNVFGLHNSSSGVQSACLDYHGSGNAHKCLSAMATLPHLETPTFIYNSVYDHWNIQCILTARAVSSQRCFAVAGWEECAKDIVSSSSSSSSAATVENNCSPAQVMQLWDWSDSLLEQLLDTGLLEDPHHGAYLHSCYTHCHLDHASQHVFSSSKNHSTPAMPNTRTPHDLSLANAISDWWNDQGSPDSSWLSFSPKCEKE